MNKWCDNCKYYRNNYGYGQCYAQKNAPRVDYNHCCENFKSKAEETEKLTVEYERGFIKEAERMTNEKAIEQLKNIQSWCETGYDTEAINIAIKAIEARPTGEWIPVSNGLPEVAERVLVTMSNGDVYIGHLHTHKDGFRWTLEPTSILYAYPLESVVAWMPLLEPYKEEE